MVIKGFENEDIEVSEFGEWVGNDYIDYKADYKEHKKIISALFKQRQELKDYLKEELKKLEINRMDFSIDYYVDRKAFLNEILSKIEKE